MSWVLEWTKAFLDEEIDIHISARKMDAVGIIRVVNDDMITAPNDQPNSSNYLTVLLNNLGSLKRRNEWVIHHESKRTRRQNFEAIVVTQDLSISGTNQKRK